MNPTPQGPRDTKGAVRICCICGVGDNELDLHPKCISPDLENGGYTEDRHVWTRVPVRRETAPEREGFVRG